jgi:hypothetical protein
MLYFCKDCPFSIFQMLNLLNVIHCDYYSFFNARVLTYRAARWFVFKPKIPIGVNFGGPLIGKCVILNGHLEYFRHLGYFMTIWYILWPFGTFYDHLVHFMTIWYMLWPFGTFYDHLVHFMNIWYILWPFGTFYDHLVHYFRFWYHVPREIWQPCLLTLSFVSTLVSQFQLARLSVCRLIVNQFTIVNHLRCK